jgi:hypothetical protein
VDLTGRAATLAGDLLAVTGGGTADQIAFASGTNVGGPKWHLAPEAHSGTDATLVVSATWGRLR